MTTATPEEKLLNLIKKDQSSARLRKDLKVFTKINILLIATIAIISVVFFADMFIFKENIPEVPKDLGLPVLEPQATSNDNEIDAEIENASAGIRDITQKRISTDEIRANLNLLGVVTGANNQAIIEDKSIGKTFFLYKDDSLGDLKVEAIKNSTVILDYKGEKIELNI